MSKLRQVTKEEFEIMTRFHPGEIRYYVDIGSSVTRNKGATIKVKAKPVSMKKAKKQVNKGDNFRKNGSANRPIQLTTTRVDYKPESISCRVQRLVKIQMEADPTKVMGRSDLVNVVARSSIFRKEQVNPVVSDLLMRGELRYMGEASA